MMYDTQGNIDNHQGSQSLGIEKVIVTMVTITRGNPVRKSLNVTIASSRRIRERKCHIRQQASHNTAI